MPMTVRLRQLKPNFHEVTVGAVTLYFSYQTIIAYMGPGGLVVRQNAWGPTTGKHLNYLSEDKAKRVPSAEFETRLAGVPGPG